MKVIWIDTETTGLDPKRNTIVQLAGIIEIDFNVVERFNFYCNPLDKEISDEALKLTRKTRKELLDYPHPDEAFRKLFKLMEKYVAKFDKTDKFIVGGFNVKFDTDFLHEWCKDRGEKYLGSFITSTTIDPLQMVGILEYLGLEDCSQLPNRKLPTLCQHFGIRLNENAHDAAFDIEATRELAFYLLSRLEGIKGN